MKISQAYPRHDSGKPDLSLWPPAVAASHQITAFPSCFLTLQHRSVSPRLPLGSRYWRPFYDPDAVGQSLTFPPLQSPVWSFLFPIENSKHTSQLDWLQDLSHARPCSIHTFNLLRSSAQEFSGMSSSILTTIFVYSPLLFNLRHSPEFTKFNQIMCSDKIRESHSARTSAWWIIKLFRILNLTSSYVNSCAMTQHREEVDKIGDQAKNDKHLLSLVTD